MSHRVSLEKLVEALVSTKVAAGPASAKRVGDGVARGLLGLRPEESIPAGESVEVTADALFLAVQAQMGMGDAAAAKVVAKLYPALTGAESDLSLASEASPAAEPSPAATQPATPTVDPRWLNNRATAFTDFNALTRTALARGIDLAKKGKQGPVSPVPYTIGDYSIRVYVRMQETAAAIIWNIRRISAPETQGLQRVFMLAVAERIASSTLDHAVAEIGRNACDNAFRKPLADGGEDDVEYASGRPDRDDEHVFDMRDGSTRIKANEPKSARG